MRHIDSEKQLALSKRLAVHKRMSYNSRKDAMQKILHPESAALGQTEGYKSQKVLQHMELYTGVTNRRLAEDIKNTFDEDINKLHTVTPTRYVTD